MPEARRQAPDTPALTDRSSRPGFISRRVAEVPPAQRSSPPAPRLVGLGTAVPSHRLEQDEVRTFAERILGPRYPDFGRLAKTFDTAGVRTRFSVCPIDWFETDRDLQARNEVYLHGATSLFVAAAERSLAVAGLKADEIDTIVTVSSTGIATPTLDARAMAHLPFRSDVRRVPVFGLGCAGGVSGLALAARLARADPGSRVLLVCIETCTLAFRGDRARNADIIATVLFGDGAAAACVTTAETDGPAVGHGYEHTWPDTLPIMGWDVDARGLGVIFDRSIPSFVTEHLATAVCGGLSALGLASSDISRLVCHPGGVKVVEAIEQVMHLAPGSLDHERTVLRDYGNMSAPTVLFVLERALAAGLPDGALLSALGPGFTVSLLPLTSA